MTKQQIADIATGNYIEVMFPNGKKQLAKVCGRLLPFAQVRYWGENGEDYSVSVAWETIAQCFEKHTYLLTPGELDIKWFYNGKPVRV